MDSEEYSLRRQTRHKTQEDASKYRKQEPEAETLLNFLGSSVVQRHLQKEGPDYAISKYIDAKKRLKEILLKDVSNDCEIPVVNEFHELVSSFKDKVFNTSQQLLGQVLPLFPWTVKRISEEFQISPTVVERLLMKENPEMNLILTGEYEHLSEMEKSARDCYENDTFSEICSSTTARVGRSSEDKPNRILFLSLKEAYLFYTDTHQSHITFSKFCLLRPKWCSVFNSVPQNICKAHENLYLMFESLPRSEKLRFNQLLSMLVCEEPSMECYSNKCDNCPGGSTLAKHLFKRFETEEYDDTTYFQWLESSTPEKVISTVREFVQKFVDLALSVKYHHFIDLNQTMFLKDCMSRIDPETAIVVLDYSENFQFVCRSSTNGITRSKNQATILSVYVHYRQRIKKAKQTISLCIISDCLTHDFSTTYCFLHEMIPFLKLQLPRIKKVIYISPSSYDEFKNPQNLHNLCHHEMDFGINAEWHFLPPHHGGNDTKFASSVKHSAMKASLNMSEDSFIINARTLYGWVCKSVPSINFMYVPHERIQQVSATVQDRLKDVQCLIGIHSFLAFVPINTASLKCAYTSNAADWQEVAFGIEPPTSLAVYFCGNIVACVFGSKWWLAKVTGVAEGNTDYKVSFMHPCGPATTFSWPKDVDECYIPSDNVLCSGIDLLLLPGGAYQLSKQHTNIISECFVAKNEQLLC